MTRIKDPNGAVTDVAASLAALVVGDGSRGFSYVDAPPQPKRAPRKRAVKPTPKPTPKPESTEVDPDIKPDTDPETDPAVEADVEEE